MAMMIRLSLLILFFWLGESTAVTKALRNSADVSNLQQLNDARYLPVSHFNNVDHFQPHRSIGNSERRHQQRRQQYPQVKSNSVVTTTERPLIRVWNSFVRSVSLPVSTFALNITNPLANFFNDGTANIIETPPPVAEYEYVTSTQANSKRRNKKNKKRKYGADTNKRYVSKQNKNQRHRKHNDETDKNIDGYESAQPTTYASDSYYDQLYMPLRVNPYEPLFFYDDQTGQYYGVHHPSSLAYYNQPNPFDQVFSGNSDVRESISYDANDSVSDKEDEQNLLLTNSAMIVTPTSLLLKGDSGGMSNKVQTLNTVKTNRPVKPIVSSDEVAAAFADDHDDEIAVVEKFDDEDNDFRSANAEDELENSLGTYMRDDLFSRLRQRIPEVNKKQSVEKQKPRQQFRYYFLRT